MVWKWNPEDLYMIFQSHVTHHVETEIENCISRTTHHEKIVLYSKCKRIIGFYWVFHTFHCQKMSGKALKMGKTLKITRCLFHESDFSFSFLWWALTVLIECSWFTWFVFPYASPYTASCRALRDARRPSTSILEGSAIFLRLTVREISNFGYFLALFSHF